MLCFIFKLYYISQLTCTGKLNRVKLQLWGRKWRKIYDRSSGRNLYYARSDLLGHLVSQSLQSCCARGRVSRMFMSEKRRQIKYNSVSLWVQKISSAFWVFTWTSILFKAVKLKVSPPPHHLKNQIIQQRRNVELKDCRSVVLLKDSRSSAKIS